MFELKVPFFQVFFLFLDIFSEGKFLVKVSLCFGVIHICSSHIAQQHFHIMFVQGDTTGVGNDRLHLRWVTVDLWTLMRTWEEPQVMPVPAWRASGFVQYHSWSRLTQFVILGQQNSRPVALSIQRKKGLLTLVHVDSCVNVVLNIWTCAEHCFCWFGLFLLLWILRHFLQGRVFLCTVKLYSERRVVGSIWLHNVDDTKFCKKYAKIFMTIIKDQSQIFGNCFVTKNSICRLTGIR